MISNAADAPYFCVQITADRRNVSVHAGTNVTIQPRFAIFGAEDNMEDDFAQGLGHGSIMNETNPELNRAFSARDVFVTLSWGVAPGSYNAAPLALKAGLFSNNG